jgi:hypothetical protein
MVNKSLGLLNGRLGTKSHCDTNDHWDLDTLILLYGIHSEVGGFSCREHKVQLKLA